MGRPAGTSIPPERRRTTTLKARTTPRFAAAAQRVAEAEGRTLASLVRVSISQYCKPRLEQLTPGRPLAR